MFLFFPSSVIYKNFEEFLKNCFVIFFKKRHTVKISHGFARIFIFKEIHIKIIITKNTNTPHHEKVTSEDRL